MEDKKKILEVKDLVIDFTTDNGILHAVRNISFDLYKGETLCIVGESGSGKSVTSKAIMGILAANAIIAGGSIMYQGENLLEVSEEEFHRIRGKHVGMIFQDPLSSLNPIVRIGKQITETLLINNDKLKIMYNDLIAEELVDYKNALARQQVNIKKEENKRDKAILELKEEEKNADASRKGEINKEIAELKAKCKERVDAIKADTKAQLPALKEALNKKKKEAKVEVKKFKDAENQRFSEYTKEWNKRMANAHEVLDDSLLNELNSEKEDFIAKHNETVNKYHEEINLQIEQAKANEQLGQVMAYENALKKYDAEQSDVLKSYEKDWAKRYKEAQKGPEILALKAEYAKEKEEHINKLKVTKAEAKKRALEVMKEVGIPFPEKRFRQYPFEFSGGMRQRIVIAIALTAAPEILICDEPTTALDVTIQAQILELIKKIQKERNISCIFITHDLGVVANMADRVAVMYAGKIVEYGLVDEIFFEPKHPYTWALLSSIPDVDSKERLDAIPGTPPNMIHPPKGDAFALRNKYALKIDFEKEPPYFKISDTHYASTWLLHPSAPKVEMPKIVSERIKNALAGVTPEANKKSVKEEKADA
ncbi:MAG: ATP-binding cassette domain-containing protein [Gammaproteobacteria bacterium]|nr:ATP-binding cassette domain-containing protein [Gammaproteobacteria bacterium]